jgi:hypothetical protein
MDELTQDIYNFLEKNPNSNARSICKELNAEKTAVNSRLYSNIGKHFFKEDLTPPLWRNIGPDYMDYSVESKDGLLEYSEIGEGTEFQIEEGDESIDEDEGWALLSPEDQQSYLVLKTCVALGGKLSRSDRSRLNQLVHRIDQAQRYETRFVEGQERKARNKAKNREIVDEEINAAWGPEERREHAIKALKVQFESNLRRLAYGYLTSSEEQLLDEEAKSDVEDRKSRAIGLIDSVRSTIDTRLSNLENMSDEELLRSTVRFGWFSRERSNRADAKSVSEMVPQFEEKEEVKTYRIRFQSIVQRIS